MNEGRKKTASVPFNFVMNFLLKIASPLCVAVSYSVAYRMIGQTEMGRVAFSNSVASFFLLAATLGIPTYGIRECAKVRGDKLKLSRTAYELLRLQIVATVLSELLLVLAVFGVKRMQTEWRLFLIQGAVLLFQGLNTDWLLSGLERYGVLTLRSVSVKVASVLLVIALIREPSDYLLYCALTVGTTAAANLLNLLAVRKEILPLRSVGALEWRKHLRPTLTFFAQAAAITVYTNLDETLLSFLRGNDEVGAYDAAVKIKLVLTYFITSLGTVLLPRFSYYVGEEEREGYQRGLRLSIDFIWLSAVPLTLFFLFLGRECLQVLCGTVPADALWSLRLLLLTLTFIGLSNVTGLQILTPQGRERIVMWSVITGAGVDLVADLILIPLYGGPGAALGTLLAEIAVLLVQLHGRRDLSTDSRLTVGAGKTLAASAVALPIVLVAGRLPFHPLLLVLIAAALYFGAVYGILLARGDPVLRLGRERALKLISHRKGES